MSALKHLVTTSSLVLSAALLACSGSESATSSGATGTGGTGAGGGGTEGAGTGGDGGGSTVPSCDDGGVDYGAPSQAGCAACFEAESKAGGCCAAPVAACTASAACTAYSDCYDACADEACVVNCQTLQPDGIALHKAVFDCLSRPTKDEVGPCGLVCMP